MTVLMISSGTVGLVLTICSSILVCNSQFAVHLAERVVRTSEPYDVALPLIDMHRLITPRADRSSGHPMPCAVHGELTPADQALKALFAMPCSTIAVNCV